MTDPKRILTDSTAAEALFLHQRLFGTAAPLEVVVAYGRAVEAMLPGSLPRTAVDIERIVTHRLDPEAVEFFLRLRDGAPNALTQRLHILMYLVEPRPEYFTRFVLPRSARGRAWLSLSWTGLTIPWRLAKGWYHVTRHGL